MESRIKQVESGIQGRIRNPGVESGIQRMGYRIQEVESGIQGLGYGIQGVKSAIQGVEFGIQGMESGVREDLLD